MYTFTCALYCFDLFPETSSHQGIIRNEKHGRPSDISRVGWGLWPRFCVPTNFMSSPKFKSDPIITLRILDTHTRKLELVASLR